jgi:hypothetical protein
MAGATERKVSEKVKMSRPVFVLRIRAEPDIDVIRSLRAWLKRGLRDFGLRCLDIHQEQEEPTMGINLNDVPDDDDLIPAGVYRLQIRLKRGGAGDDGTLRVAKKNPRLYQLELECSIVGGTHAGRKIWDYLTVDYDETYPDDPILGPVERDEKLHNMHTAVRMGRSKLKAIINSAYGLDPNDKSEAAQAKRDLSETFEVLDGLTFYAQIDVRKGNAGFRTRNIIDFVVVPGDPEYARMQATVPASQGTTVAPRSLPDDLNDDIPFA